MFDLTARRPSISIVIASITKRELQYSGHHKATREECLEKRCGEKKCGPQESSTAGGRWRWLHKTEPDRDEWSVAHMYVPPAETWRKSSYNSS